MLVGSACCLMLRIPPQTRESLDTVDPYRGRRVGEASHPDPPTTDAGRPQDNSPSPTEAGLWRRYQGVATRVGRRDAVRHTQRRHSMRVAAAFSTGRPRHRATSTRGLPRVGADAARASGSAGSDVAEAASSRNEQLSSAPCRSRTRLAPAASQVNAARPGPGSCSCSCRVCC